MDMRKRSRGNPHIENLTKKDYYRDKVVPKWDMLIAWARSGLSNSQIARNCGVHPTTFVDYIEKYEELKEHLREGREDAQIQVENALFKRAVGYEVEEITKERKLVADGKYGIVVTKKVLKQIPPDVGAAQYWLEHRAPKKWTRNPQAGIETESINDRIQGLADLLKSPVEVREIGDENQ